MTGLTTQTAYPAEFYSRQAEGSHRSAQIVIPQLLALVKVTSMVDVGCGVGPWAATFLECGVKDVLGIDGTHIDRKSLLIPQDLFLARDLEEPLQVSRKFDLAVCVEVAEHLSPTRARSLVTDLVNLAPHVLFSAAVPGQGGTGHRNEQWPSFWQNEFQKEGYRLVDCLRRQIWGDSRVEWWYRQNLLLFCRDSEYSQYASLHSNGPLDLVHPCLLNIKEYELRLPTSGYLVRSFPGAIRRDCQAAAKGCVRRARKAFRSR
jgi:SAM-dependent methyltransferase